jgi:exosortase family protein XrtF
LKKYFIAINLFCFLTKFFSFIVLTLGFWVVLKTIKSTLTTLVGRNTEQLLDLFPADVATEENKEETFIKLIYNHKYVARIIEGCNAISIIILFISFVVSFSGKLKPTLLLFWRKRTGLRIKCDANRHAECLDVSFFWPSVFLARCVIPSVYLWVVFILWVIWVSKFSLYAKLST